MSTLKVANVHFDSAGTNRIDYVGGDNILRISSGAIKLPIGDTASRPTDEEGLIRYNSQTGGFEGRNASAWGAIGGSGNALANTDGITTAGSLNISGAANITSQLTLGANLNFDTTLSTKITDPGANVMTFVTAQTERLRIDANGNIGIGNTSPGARMRIEGDSTYTIGGNMLQLSGNNQYTGMQIQNRSSSASAAGYTYYDALNENSAAVANFLGIINTDGSSEWSWSTQPSGTRADRRVERLRIDGSGNIGIGTSTPGNKLDVAGRGRFLQDAGGTTGAVVLRQASGDTNPAYLQWVNNDNTIQRGVMHYDNSGILNCTGGIYLSSTVATGVTLNSVGVERQFLWNLTGKNVYLWARDSDDYSGLYDTVAGSRWFTDPSNNLYVGNDIVAFASDERLKTNIRNIENPLEKVKSIRGVKYEFNEIGKELGKFKDGDHVGVLAGDLKKVLPEVLELAPFDRDIENPTQSKSGENYMTVKYDKIVPLLIEAIKELSSQVDELKKKLGE